MGGYYAVHVGALTCSPHLVFDEENGEHGVKPSVDCSLILWVDVAIWSDSWCSILLVCSLVCLCSLCICVFCIPCSDSWFGQCNSEWHLMCLLVCCLAIGYGGAKQ